MEVIVYGKPSALLTSCGLKEKNASGRGSCLFEACGKKEGRSGCCRADG